MPRSSIDVIGPAFQRMKSCLFTPFNFGQWIRFAIVGFLAGEMGGGDVIRGRFPGNVPSPETGGFDIPGLPSGIGAAFLVLAIGIIALAVITLVIIFMYISSRMRFVLFDSVMAGESRIREFWRRRGEPAYRYFIWQLLFSIGIIVGMLFLIGIPLALGFGMGWFRNPRSHLLPLVLGGVFLFALFVAAIAVIALVQISVKDFVVPQMALEGVTVGEGWRRLWAMMKREKGGYAGYFGMKIVLAIGSAIAIGMAALIVLLILAIPVGGIGVLAVLRARAIGLTWNPLTIILVSAAAAIILAIVFFILALISVPATVFFPAFSIYFFADRYSNLRQALYPSPPPAPDVGNPLPVQ